MNTPVNDGNNALLLDYCVSKNLSLWSMFLNAHFMHGQCKYLPLRHSVPMDTCTFDNYFMHTYPKSPKRTKVARFAIKKSKTRAEQRLKNSIKLDCSAFVISFSVNQ